jgi:acyl dehydratase
MSHVISLLEFGQVRVGDALPELRKRVTAEQVSAYAAASGDHNPIHLDEAFARSVGLPGRVAHGMLTMAFVNQCLTDWLGSRDRLKSLRGRFAGLVQIGDEVICSGQVSEKDESRRRLTIQVSASNQRGERVFTKGVAEAEF